MNNSNKWNVLNSTVESCRKCPRLVEWREQVAKEKRRAFIEDVYWGKPVPGFGDPKAEVLVLGLAPGAHGSNRTGRMFTGDASGDFLYPALYNAGFASQPESRSMDDGLNLKKLFISAVCRCVPPGNKPSHQEQLNCRNYLIREIGLLNCVKGIIALGGIAFKNAYDVLKTRYSLQHKKRPDFAHGAFFSTDASPIWLLASYHPSRQNTQTGRLTKEMFSNIWAYAVELIARK